MRRIVFALTCFAMLSFSAESTLLGQTQSTSLAVNAVVVKNCTITTAPVAFGNYDSVAVNATAPLDALGTVTVACTKGAPAKIGLGAGANAQGAARRMVAGATEYLSYELYKDAGHASIWGNTAADALDIPAAPNRNPRTFSIYGRVAPAQDATVGTYVDTVVATVNF
jgi:spore coat protein U domain-containing protein, fimbrial subunit CupE1/2/3/6